MKVGETLQTKLLRSACGSSQCPFCGGKANECGINGTWVGINQVLVTKVCNKSIEAEPEKPKPRACNCPIHLLMAQGCTCGGV